MDGAQLNELAKERDNVLALEDADRLGLSRAALSQHARRHSWLRPCPGVMLLPGTVITYVRAVLIAVKAAGGRRVLVTGRTAAYLWGLLREPPRVIELLVPADRHDRELAGLQISVSEGGREFTVTVRVRRSRNLKQADVGRVRSLPVATPARTIIDLAAVLDVDDLRTLVIDARQRKLLTLEELRQVHARNPRYRGRAKVRHVLADLDEQACDSRLEWDFRVEARRRGFTPHPRPFPYRCSDGVVIEIDVAFPEAWVACECHGFGAHSQRSSLVKDNLRQNRAVIDGWRPFEVDWTRLKRDADALFAELALLLASADPARPPAQPADPAQVNPRFRSRRRC